MVPPSPTAAAFATVTRISADEPEAFPKPITPFLTRPARSHRSFDLYPLCPNQPNDDLASRSTGMSQPFSSSMSSNTDHFLRTARSAGGDFKKIARCAGPAMGCECELGPFCGHYHRLDFGGVAAAPVNSLTHLCIYARCQRGDAHAMELQFCSKRVASV
jgi:hypothetical protein